MSLNAANRYRLLGEMIIRVIETITTMIVDDHPIVRKGLRTLLDVEEDIEVLADFDKVSDAVSFVRGCSVLPKVCILDLSLPGESGFSMIQQLEKMSIKILVLSMHEENTYASRAINMGAHGYLMKSEPLRRSQGHSTGKWWAYLVGTEFKSVANESAVNPHLLSSQNIVDCLSNREFEVLNLVAAGMKPKQIAEKMQLSTKTVNVYKEKLKDKLGLTSSTQLLQFASNLEQRSNLFWKKPQPSMCNRI